MMRKMHTVFAFAFARHPNFRFVGNEPVDCIVLYLVPTKEVISDWTESNLFCVATPPRADRTVSARAYKR